MKRIIAVITSVLVLGVLLWPVPGDLHDESAEVVFSFARDQDVLLKDARSFRIYYGTSHDDVLSERQVIGIVPKKKDLYTNYIVNIPADLTQIRLDCHFKDKGQGSKFLPKLAELTIDGELATRDVRPFHFKTLGFSGYQVAHFVRSTERKPKWHNLVGYLYSHVSQFVVNECLFSAISAAILGVVVMLCIPLWLICQRASQRKTLRITSCVIYVLLLTFPLILVSLSSWGVSSFGQCSVIQMYEMIASAISTAGATTLLSFLGALMLPVIACQAFTFCLYKFTQHGNRAVLFVCMVLGLDVLAVTWWRSFTYVDKQLGLVYEWENIKNESQFFSEEFVEVDPKRVQFPQGKKNLVFIMAESLENTFYDERWCGKNLLPGLSALQRESLSYRQEIQVWGTEYTAGAESSILFGIPRLFIDKEGIRNDTKARHHAPYPDYRATSIWRVLVDSGYQCEFMQGGTLDFSDSRGFFASVPEMKVKGKDELLVRHPEWLNNGMLAGTTFLDEQVIPEYKATLTRLAKGDRPFAVMFKTFNLHCPDGFLVKGRPRRRDEKIEEVVLRTDEALTEFVQWIEKQPFANNTIVIISGDHQFMKDFSTVSRKDRSVFNLVRGCGIKPEMVNRKFAAFDLAPTIIELLGAQLPNHRMGLGTSLISGEPTLLERVGVQTYQDEIHRSTISYRKAAFGW